jgi:ATP-dependent Lon protease
LIFNNITTNKNKIEIAPTYTIKKIIDKNSQCKNPINTIETKINEIIKEKIECIGFRELIIKIAKNKIHIFNKLKKKSIK